MSAFKRCFAHTVGVEGGYSDHKADRGGATKYGITIATLGKHRAGRVSKEDVKGLRLEEAERIYQRDYWNRMRLNEVGSGTLQLILFDVGVNRGTTASAKNLQEVLRKDFKKRVVADGVIGPKTLQATNSVDPIALGRKLIQKVQSDYAEIVKRNPPQAVFLKGWINRTHQLWDASGC